VSDTVDEQALDLLAVQEIRNPSRWAISSGG
jgi:hypothetical protein